MVVRASSPLQAVFCNPRLTLLLTAEASRIYAGFWEGLVTFPAGLSCLGCQLLGGLSFSMPGSQALSCTIHFRRKHSIYTTLVLVISSARIFFCTYRNAAALPAAVTKTPSNSRVKTPKSGNVLSSSLEPELPESGKEIKDVNKYTA